MASTEKLNVELPSPLQIRAKPATRHLCSGDSLGLDVYECDGWVDFYDTLHGDGWVGLARETCSNLRKDPCGCKVGS